MSKAYTYIRRHLALLVVTSSAGLSVFAAGNEDGVVYKNISEVKARYKLVEGTPLKWMGEAQGTKSSSSTTYYWRSYGGQYWTQYSRIPVGTIVAIPTEDFQCEATFSYRDAKWIVREGKLISLTIGIFVGNKSPSPTAKMRAVKSLCEAGAALPRDKGRPGRILALKSAAKRRFGARTVDVFYDDANSKVRFLLQDCRRSEEDDTVTSICYEGTKKQDEKAMVESNTTIKNIRRTR